ncbi:hypothetical protein H4N58_19765 [Mumia sp. ZJ1417]|uniref:hypothetical protein n=1 Tax=Mumia sp. ZJ1417 TaxID=2708082 RepID=UPI00141F6349|nr:hypothetical protein [Mumia sp. ZJ1417]QMW66336.1 hypothetical protein H4N58_19765 [Mumia sp. ZJ1417]
MRLLYLMLRTPKEFTLPRGVVKVGEVREDDEDFAVESALPFHAEAGTQAVLAWAWPITHDPADLDDIDDVPVWLDVIEGTDVAAVMIGERRVGTTTVPEGTYDALRLLDRRQRRCVPDGSLDLRRLPDGQLVVEHLDVELP